MNIRLSIVAGLCLAVIFNGSAWAFDLTGSWGADEKCAYWQAGTLNKVSDTISVSITQSGADMNVNFLSGPLQNTYNGLAVTDAGDSHKGGVGLIGCGSADAQGAATMDLKVKTKDDGTASMKGTGGVVIIGVGVTGSCKLKLYRVNPADPGVGPCL